MNEFEQRRAARLKERKLKKQRMRKRIAFFLIIAILLTLGIYILANNNSDSSGLDGKLIINDVVYPMPPEPTYDLISAINSPDGVKTCYLTFDDGPTNSVTSRILDTLRRYNAKATFFMVGTLIEENADMARRVYDEGHFLANHSYSHNYSDMYADKEAFMKEIDQTNSLICNVTGRKSYTKIFRFPGGGFNSGKHGEAKQSYKITLNENNIRYCDWNALNGDAEGGSPTAEELVARVKSSTSGKEDVVILMHDAAAKSTTADALAEIIEYLLSEGYMFKTLDEAPII